MQSQDKNTWKQHCSNSDGKRSKTFFVDYLEDDVEIIKDTCGLKTSDHTGGSVKPTHALN